LYLGCFSFDEPGDEEHEGTFQVVVEAANPEQAVNRMRTRLRKLRTAASLFDSPTTIYLDGFIELKGSFKDGLLVNWVSGPARSPSWQIMNLVPEQDHEAEAYGVDDESKDDAIEPFLDFGGQSFRKALEASRAKDRSGTQPVNSIGLGPGTHPARAPQPGSTAEQRAEQRKEAARTKELRRAEREALKQKRQAAAEAKKERDRRIAETLAELRRD
jgi:hypothetical protein